MTDHAKATEAAGRPLSDAAVDRITAAVLAGPETGRLDRILAEQAQRQWFPVEDPPTLMQEFDARGAEVERLRGMVAALEAECAALTKLTATCTCTPYPAGDGPEADCAVHGAVRAFNDATRELAALAAALDAVTHDLLPCECGGDERDHCDICGDGPAGKWHCTSARVRAEHGHGAT